jgi:NlpC/P60 family putative phage cell wall peptidase
MTAAPIDPGAIVAEARRWIGTPYRHAASVRGVGCDCLGLVRGVWRALYGDEPEPTPVYSADWAEATRRETLRDTAARHMGERPRDAAAAGDLLLFRWREGLPAKHCGIATGEGRMVHAHDGARVVEIDLGLWRPRLAYVYRFPNVREPGP